MAEIICDYDFCKHYYGALKDLPSEQRFQNPNWRRFNRVFDILDHRWRYTDEVLKLIREGEDV